ncbi:MAG: hypothetical protein RLY47_611 [Candidatus Parcubacteria bacterium]|jgi:branched-chain amino acid transport system substrate-binding protein
MSTGWKWVWGVVVVVVIVLAWSVYSKENRRTSSPESSMHVGAVLPLTGGLAFVGEDYKQGMELAAHEFGINLVVQDGGADPTESLNAARQLEEAGVDVILSAFRGASLSIGSSYGKNVEGPLIFATTATSNKQPIGDLGKNFFALGAEMISAGEVIGSYAQDTCKSAATLTETTDAGLDKVAGFSQGLGETKVVYGDTFSPDTTDFRTLILKVKEAKADCLFIEVRSNAMVNFLKQIGEFEMDIPIYTNSYSVNADVVQQSPSAQVEQVIFSSTKLYNQTTEQKKFFGAYRQEYGEEPNDFAAVGYEMVRIIAEASKECGRDRECVREILRNLDQESIVGPLVTDQYQEIKLTEYGLFGVKDGAFVTVQ